MTSVIGSPAPRVDAFDKVTGLALFGADIKLPHMMYGCLHLSTQAHAKILNVNIEKAKAVPGVKAVITGQDIALRHGGMLQDEPFLAVGKVRYFGEPVAAVLAEDYPSAREAAALVEVEYEPLPALLDVLEAWKQGAVLIHENMMDYPRANAWPIAGRNIPTYTKVRRGDTEAGFADSYHIEENWFETPMIQHTPIETHCAIAKYDPSGHLTVWTPAQSPFYTRSELARSLNMSQAKLRVIGTKVGAGFGSKHEVVTEPWAILLAQYANYRPVMLNMTREEEFTTTVVRGVTKFHMRTGVSKEGLLLAQEVEAFWDCGAYAGWAPFISRNAGFGSGGPYVIPNVKIDSYCVYTNKPHRGPYRTFGFGEASWAHDSQMDAVAKSLGMDTYEIKLKNALEDGQRSLLNEPIFSCGLKDCLKTAAQDIGWDQKKQQPSAAHKRRGRGIACMWKMTGTPSSSLAIVRLNEDGSAMLHQSLVDMGQGSETIFAQIVAQELTIPLDNVMVTTVDTEFTPYERSTTSSRGTFHTGNAVLNAARDVKQIMLEAVAKKWQVDVSTLDVGEGDVFEKGGEKRRVPVKGLWGQGFLEVPIIGRGTFKTNDIFVPVDYETGQSERPTAFWMWGAQAVELEVDMETGQLEIIKVSAAHDVGKALNPLNVKGQIEGSVMQGIGTVFEEVKFDGNGKALNTNFHTYQLPTAMDVEYENKAIILEHSHREGPYGAKGIGEGALAPTACAVANAVFDALGVQIKNLPLTMENIHRVIKEHDIK